MPNENFTISDPDRIRVLIVDDSDSIRKIVARSIEPEGYDLGFASEIRHIQNLPLVKELTQWIPDAFVILNACRQIVYCNNSLMSLSGLEHPEKIYGLRLGEALNCIHSVETEGGCGRTGSCKYCRAGNLNRGKLFSPYF